jgi:nitrogen fixation protein NifU and related proteins
MYREIVLDHFSNPRNVGEIENPDGYAQAESSACGDMIEVYIRVENDHLADIKYRTFGCAAAIASSSFASELLTGASLETVMNITDAEIAEKLGLPEFKYHCSVMVMQALHRAINEYYAEHPEADKRQTASSD